MPKVHFVTLSRSDYATTRPIALAAQKDCEIEVVVSAGGSHLLARFGKTIEAVKADGLSVDYQPAFLRDEDNSEADIAAAYARAVAEFVEIFTKDQPDFVFIVGDRWEMIAVATAASMLGLPIAHHSGGDITQGSADNQTRYVLTTLSHLHFTALEEHSERLKKMGEESWRVTTTGEPVLLSLQDFADKMPDIHAALDIPQGDFVLATFHPTSYDDLSFEAQVEHFIAALDEIEETIVLTAPNPDPGSNAVFEKLHAFAGAKDNIYMFEALGTERYFAAMDKAKYMIGNSSSGLWEAPSFALPVINMGSRQGGRVRGNNVVDCGFALEEIKAAMDKVQDPAFIASIQGKENPYIQENALELILGPLKVGHDKAKLLSKTFVDPLKV